MGDRALGTLAAVIGGLIFVAIVAVVFSKNADTANVLTSGGTALSKVIQASVAPVSSSGNTFGSGN